MRRALALLVLSAACSGDGYAIDLTLVFDGAVSDDDVARATRLHVEVTGDEPYRTDVATSGKWIDRSATLRYLPRKSGGSIAFALSTFADDGTPIASGALADVALAGGRTQRFTVTLYGTPTGGDGGDGGDGGSGDLSCVDACADGGGGDMACAGVTVCLDGDGCCPRGCNNATDRDCAPVCGNGVVETNEFCDDDNTNNGDACDPTCQWRNAVTIVSGVPGDRSFADGLPLVARYDALTGITSDGNHSLFVADNLNATVRRIDLNPSGQMVSTLAGHSFDQRTVDGPGATARFKAPRDVQYVNGVLWVSDDSEVALRSIDLSSGMVTTVLSNAAATVQSTITGLGTDGAKVLFIDAGGLHAYNPGNGGTTLIAAGVAGSDVAFDPVDGNYYVAGGTTIKQVTPLGAVSVFAGSSTSGCTDAQPSPAAATFESAYGIYYSAANGLVVADDACDTLRRVSASGVTTMAGQANMHGYVNSTTSPTLARFYQITSVTDLSTLGTFASEYVNATVREVAASGVVTASGAPKNGTTTLGASGTTSIYASATFRPIDAYATHIYGSLSPRAIVSDGSFLYASDDTRILKIVPSTGQPTVLKDLSPNSVGPLTLLGGTLYVGTIDAIRTVSTDGATTALWAGTPGNAAPPNDGARLAATIYPIALANDGTNLYFVDQANTIRKVDATQVSTLAGTAGTSDVVDNTGGNAHFANPMGLACDGKNLYVIDGVTVPGGTTASSGRGTVVRQISLATRSVTTLAGMLSVAGSADGIGKSARFAGAIDLTTDGRVLLVSDAGGSFIGFDNQLGGDGNGPTVREIELATGRVTTMLGARGQWSALAATGTAALLDVPGPISFDAVTHTIYLFDLGEGAFLKMR
jgi:cysteine-rich repeat protein